MNNEYDFSKGVKNPYAGKFIKNGKFTAVIEHGGYDEIAEFDVKTGNKTVHQLIVTDKLINIDDKRVSV